MIGHCFGIGLLLCHVRRKHLGSVLIVAIVFLGFGSANAQQAQEHVSRYKNLRYDEDFFYLRDPAKRSNPFDLIKYIPIRTETDDWYLSLGGEVKERFESWRNPNWGEADKEDQYLLQRFMIHADLHAGPARAFVQLRSAFKTGGSAPEPIDQDSLDLQQGFIDVRLSPVAPVTIRLGRQELLYGSTRLVSVREGANIRRSFDGMKTMVKIDSWAVDAWITQPVNIQDGLFNDQTSTDRAFWGAYAVYKWRSSLLTSLDLYYLGIRKDDATYNQGKNDEVRHTVGIRPWGTTGNWDYDLELTYQFGKFGHADINAWMAATNSGYTFHSLRFKPRMGLKIEIASGDRNPENSSLQTFNPLFHNSFLFNETDLVGLSNLFDIHPYISFWPRKNVWWSFDWAFFWRENTDDAVYNNVMQIQRRPTKSSSPSTGSTASSFIRWQVTPHLSLYGAYSHFFSGPFIKETGPGGDVDFLGLWGVFKF